MRAAPGDTWVGACAVAEFELNCHKNGGLFQEQDDLSLNSLSLAHFPPESIKS